MPKSRHSNRKPSHSSGSLFLNVPKELSRIEELIAKGNLEQALRDVNDLARRAPHRADVFETMMLLGVKMNEAHAKLEAALRLVELQPFVATHHYNLFAVYLQNNFPALALQTGAYFLGRWPDSKFAEEISELMQDVEAKLREQPLVAQFPEENRIEKLALVDRIALETFRGKHERAVAHATQLLEQMPDFVPAYNNRALAYWLMGENEAALEDTQRALALEPNNFHALFMSVRLLCLVSRIKEARAAMENFKVLQAAEPEVWAKQAEAFAYLGDEAATLELAAQAEAAGMFAQELPSVYWLRYFAGAAAARLHEVGKAHAFLNKAKAHVAVATLAGQHLQDLEKPLGQREGASALALEHWIPRKVVEEFMHIMAPASRGAQHAATKAAMQKYFAKYPHLPALLPVLLARGDRLTRELAQHMARLADTPELWQTLKDFASSAHGTDQLRNEALHALVEAGQFAEGESVAFWSRGKLTEVKVSRHTDGGIA